MENELALVRQKKSMSVPEMGRLLGLKKTESYYLLHKGFFESTTIGNNMRVMVDSFEDWYRLALYCAQNGKCYVTGKPLVIGRIHCHHKTPLKYGGTDEYKNLVLIDEDVHKLIHAVKGNIVNKYVELLKPNYYHRDKINRYRKKLNLEPI